MGRNFDDYPGFQPFRSWANTYAQDCRQKKLLLVQNGTISILKIKIKININLFSATK